MNYNKTTNMIFTALTAMTLLGCGADSVSSASGSDKSVGVVVKTVSNQFWATMQKGAEASAKASGTPVTVQSASSEKGIEEQTSILQSMSGEKYGCFAVVPITVTNLIQPLVAVQKAGKPIINLDTAIDPAAASAAGLNIASFISSNNEDAGKRAAEFLAKKLGSDKKVALVGGISGDSNSNARMSGFRKAAQAAGLIIVQEVAANWDREKALNAATAIIQTNPDVAAFYSANDGMALGIVQAKKNEGKEHILVVGTDGNEEAVESVRNGGLTATISQYPYAMGELGVDACRAAIAGATLPKKVDVPIALITADNAQKALDVYPKPFEAYDNPFKALIK